MRKKTLYGMPKEYRGKVVPGHRFFQPEASDSPNSGTWAGPKCRRCAKLPWSTWIARKRCLCAGFSLDIGCGGIRPSGLPGKQPGFIGMDLQDVKGVDIVWNIESVEDKCRCSPAHPWPFQDSTVDRLLASHILEHLKPWNIIGVFNEMWRVMAPGSQAMIAVPYAGSFGFYQDPTHVKQFNEATWAYFDPEHKSALYNIYRPKPWHFVRCNFNPLHNMEIIMEPRK